MAEFKRLILSEDDTKTAVTTLQKRLVDLIDLALQLKQAHWTVVGQNFRTVHLQLDEILVDVRNGSDDVAERISTLGIAPDGLAKTVAGEATLKQMEVKFDCAKATITIVADMLKTTISGLRESIEIVGEIDPISEDILIQLSGSLEKHLWMVQAQEM